MSKIDVLIEELINRKIKLEIHAVKLNTVRKCGLLFLLMNYVHHLISKIFIWIEILWSLVQNPLWYYFFEKIEKILLCINEHEPKGQI